MANNAQVQLGFALSLHENNADYDESTSRERDCELLGHRSPRWSDWDGGKIGGAPSWLNPRDLPVDAPLRCRGPCAGRREGEGGTSMRFVAQLYCPADDDAENEAAFHRSLYVFVCPVCCSAPWPEEGEERDESCATSLPLHRCRLSECVRVLRCQLPKHNDFYPPTGGGGDHDGGWTRHTSKYWAKSTNDNKLNLCAVCGQRSRGRCPKQQLWFCGIDHQKEKLRACKQVKKQKSDDSDSGGGDLVSYLPSLYQEYELVVEEEPVANTGVDAFEEIETNVISKGALFPSKDLIDADADLEQSDLNALTGNLSLAEVITGVTDPATLTFYGRMAIGGEENDVRDQVLRYCRWPGRGKVQTLHKANEEEAGPLWLSSNHRPHSQFNFHETSFPPPCQYCGAPRAFEFQILPQMLHHLLHNPDDAIAGGEGGGGENSRVFLTKSEKAVLLEAKSKIESGVDLPEGFKEEYEAAVANAREVLLGTGKDLGMSDSKLDWGTIAIYTCTSSCGNGGVVSENIGAYMEETAWMQPPLD